MSSNSSSNSTGNNNGGNNNADFAVAAVALVVSVVALMATFMQVMQQYYASAQGYSQCNEKVMGDWAKSKTRRFRWDELRFEVEFDAPVIFVSPPTNKNGPVPNTPIHFLDGSQESLNETHTASDINPRKEYEQMSPKARLHTADNERASWFVMLHAIQQMESASRKWQKKEYSEMGPPAELLAVKFPREPPLVKDAHTLTVALQRKRKSWDTMPTSITKPYATTTMCHLIEIMATLSVYWKEFDRKRDRYWAEGNGFMILGERSSDLGVIFSFQTSGQSQFERTRVVPVDEIKELCFGYVPTIYRDTLDQRRVAPPSDEQPSLSSLQFGSTREVAETLTGIGCNHNTIRCFLDDGKRTSHIFPVTFEIMGMISRVFHIDNSTFTYIPNPTTDRWDKRVVDLSQLLFCYLQKVDRVHSEVSRNQVIIGRFKQHIDEILNYPDEKNSLQRMLRFRALHAALDDTDEILTGKVKKRHAQTDSSLLREENGALPPFLRQIDPARRAEQRRQIVQDVLRHHIQEVLRMMNQAEERFSDTVSTHLGVGNRNHSPRGDRSSHHRFDDLHAAGPDDRLDIFMDLYFDVVRHHVVASAAHTTDRRNSLNGGRSIAGTSHRSSHSTHRAPHALLTNVAGSPISISTNMLHSINENGPQTDIEKSDPNPVEVEVEAMPVNWRPLAEEEVSHDDIWCTLVFRMICWLMMHDFNKNDVQINKSELLGSRMPVYIS